MRRQQIQISLPVILLCNLLSTAVYAAPKQPNTISKKPLSVQSIKKMSSKPVLPRHGEPAYLEKMPKGAYLRRPAPTAASLVKQVSSDSIVRQRYEKAWGIPRPSVLAQFQRVRLTKLPHSLVMKVYYFRPATGIWGYRLRRVKQGCPIFVHANGTPFLVQVCGNPLKPADARTKDLPKTEATTIKEFDPDESLATDLVTETPTSLDNTDAGIAPEIPTFPTADDGSTTVASNSEDTLSSGGGSGSGGGGGGGGSIGGGSIGGGGGGSFSGAKGSSAAPTTSTGSSAALQTTAPVDGGRTRRVPTDPTTSSSSDSTGDTTGGSIGGEITGGGSTGSDSLSTPEPSLTIISPTLLFIAAIFKTKNPLRPREEPE